MLAKSIILLFTVVWQVLAITPFVEEGKRAKFFELTDNEIPTFRVTLPEGQLEELKEACQAPFDGNDDYMERSIKAMKGEKAEPKVQLKEFKTKEATMVVEVNGEKKSFDKVTFSVGGNSSRYMARQGYNLKIRGKQELYGRTQFKLRSDAHDATYLRSKLACDIHNRLGLDTGSATYAILYINDEYFGLHVLLDSIKLSWVEKKFDDKDSAYLYHCDAGGCFINENCKYTCENQNEDVTDNSEYIEFLKKIDHATSAEEIEKYFDVESFLYETAYEYLAGGWDHFFHPGHNFDIYKQKNGIWKMVSFDYDNDFGQDVVGVEYGLIREDVNPNKDYVNYTFDEWMNRPIRLIDILVYKNKDRFKKVMSKFVSEAFNPGLLFPHIDELKELIRPHVEYDKTPGEDGIHPGIVNFANPIEYSLEQWEVNTEFTTISLKELNGSAYGLKYWILTRYRKVCETFDLECDPVYMDKDYKYEVDKSMEGVIDTHKFDGVDFSIYQGGNPFYHRDSNDTYSYSICSSKSTTTQVSVETTVEEPTEIETETETAVEEPTQTQTSVVEPTQTQAAVAEPTETQTADEEQTQTQTSVVEPTQTQTQTADEEPTQTQTADEEPTQTEVPTPKYECLSEIVGYPCCPKSVKKVYQTDVYGDWGYDFSKKQWCGLTPYEDRAREENCWSESLGYPCCIGCYVEETDEDGQWGYENNEWCGIPSFCSE